MRNLLPAILGVACIATSFFTAGVHVGLHLNSDIWENPRLERGLIHEQEEGER